MALLTPPPGPVPDRAQTVLGSEVAKTPQASADQGDYDDAQLLDEARKFLDYVEEQEHENRDRAADMLRFIYKRGCQWPDKVRRERESDNRPCLELNQLPQFINQVTNDERQNRPAIKIRPTSDDASQEMAEYQGDLIRHIEYDSNAGAVYDNGFKYATAANVGYWRIVTEYENEKSFYQKLLLKPIRNPLSVYYDPDCKEPDGSDAEKCLVSEEISRDEFERRYPDAASIDWQTTDPILTAWVKSDSIRIADYLHVVKEADTLYQLVDGSTCFASEVDKQPTQADEFMPMPGQYTQKRDVDRVSVRWEVINGNEVLERHEWAGSGIPIIPCFGDEVDIEGERIRMGLVDNAEDPQQMYNYLVSAAAEGASNQPKAPWTVAEGQLDGREREWGQANAKNYPYLVYRKYGENGSELGYGPPQRSSPDVDVSGMLGQAQNFQQLMRFTTGVQDPMNQMGVQDQSGRAILAKERISNLATFHFQDNLTRAIRLTGKRLLELIPKVYDTQRTLQLLKEDGTQYQVTFNQQQPAVQPLGQPGMAPPPPIQPPPLNDVTQGSYDVIVDTGPSYQTKRVEFVNSALELAQASPDLLATAGDLIVKNMDWPGSEQIAARLKVMLPPAIQMLEAQKSQDPQVIGLAQQLQQLQQQMQQQGQAASQAVQKVQDQNQQLTSENLQLKALNAQIKASAQDKSIQARADVQTQMMESHDVAVHAQIDKQRAAIDMWRIREETALKRDQVALQLFETIMTLASKLGPQGSVQGAQAAEGALPGAEQAVMGAPSRANGQGQ